MSVILPQVRSHFVRSLRRRETASRAAGPRRWLACLLVAIACLTTARAQSVRWEAADSDDPSALQLIFENCAPEGDPQLPTIEGVTFSLLGRSEQTSIVNLSMTRTTVISYRARAQRSGPLRIPAFSVQTNKGTIRVPAFNSAAVAESNITSRIELSAPSVWAGEVFSLTYVLDVSRRAFNQLGSNIEWDAAPLVVEDWSKFEPSEAQVGGETRLRISSRTRGYAKAPGAVTLHAANQLVNLQSGSIGFGLFQTPRIEQLAVTSNQPPLLVRALPSPPPGFSGAVGQFKLSSKVIPTNATVGEPITWTIELTGTGNWPEIAGLPQRSVSKDFNVVQPQARRTPAEGKLFDSTLTEDVVLVPTRAGSYTLEPVSFVYFDPALGRYQTVSTPRQTVAIAAPPPPPAPTATPESAAPAKTEPAPKAEAATPRIPPPPTTPLGIPRDPLPGETTAMVPLSAPVLISLVILPFALLLFFWAWLAVRRAQMTDRERHRRAAKERLTATLGALRTARGPAGTAVRAQLLLQWQHDTAILWQIRHAAPSAAVFAGQSGSRTSGNDGVGATWCALWEAADRALYSPNAELPVEWVDRAEAALAEKRVPGFRVYTALLPRNLLPFVAVLALCCVLAPRVVAETATAPTMNAAEAAQAYRRGEFDAAAKAWAELLARNPTDAIARHNLSLALAQQDRWGEAAAHAAGAFVQRPRSEPVQWQLALTAGKAGYIPAPLAGFLPAGPVQALARLASPGAWQMILAAAAALFAAAIAVLLIGAYHRSSRRRIWASVMVMGLALVLALAALASLRAFGPTADRRAVIAWRTGTLRSIPTEADTTQKTTPLPAGSVGLAGQTFLGWVQLTFDNGQTGWVRQDDLIALWK
ncbi:BatD family protein [Opitutus terrae]|uniref:Uncharacterized protein n=1 Tax=Opitutus terrae (strain DSM 11246 / JCM 15787 / PB90-1) TaxID=452637 RepID=B1ZS77_OPITP|nr:BatD family protein [Opitutus terrae]ACB75676.1 hypothetical protein Oter_2394 [Opitutus terrae PB90-1]